MLKAKWATLLFVILFSSSSYAADAKSSVPSDASLKELLAITHASDLRDRSLSQYDNLVKSIMQQALQGETITAEQQKFMDTLQKNMLTIIKEELAWDKTEPMLLKIYRNSFTQEEVDGMISFYKTPAGQAVIKKMPLVMQNMFAEMQTRMGPIIVKMKKMMGEALADIKSQNMKESKEK